MGGTGVMSMTIDYVDIQYNVGITMKLYSKVTDLAPSCTPRQ